MKKNRMTVDKIVERQHESPALAELDARCRKQASELRDLKALLASDDRLYEALRDAVRALPAPRAERIPTPKLSHADSSAILSLADVHAEEYVDSEEMEGFAHYDWNTFLDRMWTTAHKTIELTNIMRQAGKVDELHVFGLGDLLTGQIHLELDRTNTFNLPEAVVNVAYVLAQTMNLLAGHFKQVHFAGVCGNHGRSDIKPVHKQRADRNWDTAVYRIARLLLANTPNISWLIPRSPAVCVNVRGTRIVIKHGDDIKARGVTPFYGLARDTSEEHSKRRGERDFDLVMQGHLHIFAKLEDRVLCPSMIGTSQYSFNKLHSVAKPQQLLCFANEKHGVSTFWPINLEQADGHGFKAVPR